MVNVFFLSEATGSSTQFFGHDPVLRPSFMSKDGEKSYVDTNVTLTRGTLQAIRWENGNLNCLNTSFLF